MSSAQVPPSQYGPNTPHDNELGLPGMKRGITGEEKFVGSSRKKEVKNVGVIDEEKAQTPAPAPARSKSEGTVASDQGNKVEKSQSERLDKVPVKKKKRSRGGSCTIS